MMRALFALIFGCRHRRCSWPLTVRKPRKRTYVACLSCGAEFDYDLQRMQICPATVKLRLRLATSFGPAVAINSGPPFGVIS